MTYKKLVAILFAAAVAFWSTDVWAMRGSVIAGKRGVTSEGRNKVKQPIGKKGENGGGGGGGGGNAAPSKRFKKWALPPAVEVAEVNTSKFDEVAEKLKLSDEQSFNIDKVKKELNAERDRLVALQKEARASYDRARDAASCMAAAQEVSTAVSACKRFNPDFVFKRKLAKILTADQYAKFRELSAKV